MAKCCRWPKTPDTSLRRLRWSVWLLAGLVIGLALGAVGRPVKAPAEASSGANISAARALLPAIDDPLYDQFLQEFKAPRGNAERRRSLTAQVLAAAAAHRVDADLLFALVAAESGFNTRAVSPKGARGLGQMQFRTAHAVAPDVVRRPEDLHDVRRNLYATARHIRQLLDEQEGDLRSALRVYLGGASDRKRQRPDRHEYVARVSTYYAYLKARRTHQYLTSLGPEGSAAARR